MLRISDAVAFPVELTTRRSAIFGMSGSGKSNTATRIIELLLDLGEQIVLVDPKGEGWGLQSSADGKSSGYDVIIFGKPFGNVPDLREEHAEQIADFVVDSGRSVVLSLLGFDDDQAERRFVTRFCKRLYRRKSQAAQKTRLLVVFDEAHLFLPENASGGNAGMVGAIKRIGRQGRSAGLGLMLVDQRPQEVAKSVISQCELLIVHQLAHKLDRDALRDWVKAYDRDGQGEAFLASLAELKPGEAWVWSPAWLGVFVRTRVERRKTFDSGATPDGEAAAAPKVRAAVDLEALRDKLAKVVNDARANDPALLRAEVVRLRNELERAGKASPAAAAAAAPKRVDVPVVRAADVKRLEALLARWPAVLKHADAWREKVEGVALRLEADLGRARREGEPTRAAAGAMASNPPRLPPEPPPAFARPSSSRPAGTPTRANPTSSADQAAALGDGSASRMIGVLAQFSGGLDARRLASRAGVSRKKSTYRNAMSTLRKSGFITSNGDGLVELTDVGRHAAANVTPLPTGRALIEHFRAELGEGAARRIFDALVSAWPTTATKDDLAAAAGVDPKTSTFRNAMVPLRNWDLVDGKTELRLSTALGEVLAEGRR